MNINASILKTSHIAEINSQLLPKIFYQIPQLSFLTNSKIGSLPNLTREQENEIIYTNPTLERKIKSESLSSHQQKGNKYNYQYNTMIQLNSKKIYSYFENQQYSDFFQLVNIYISSLFNGATKEQIMQLYNKQQITDSVYIFAMKCLDIIESNTKSYKYIKSSNSDNLLSATESFYKIILCYNSHLKDHSLLLLTKFQVLLGVIDKVAYKNEMKEIENIFKEFQ